MIHRERLRFIQGPLSAAARDFAPNAPQTGQEGMNRCLTFGRSGNREPGRAVRLQARSFQPG
ncbi:hypothetical protein DQX05_21600 [Paenibacillus thiaminolyticus]|uniref:Uncharacterized protein n=1 Tax=Paenibacillus thiaminolyticus TaxID=49283 RepID=A0A3A3GYY2_PANTH|nr:hypothetical protein DQX05_21600 [Paenibacillus thiaminolyticus]